MSTTYVIISEPFNGYVYMGPSRGLSIEDEAAFLADFNKNSFKGLRPYATVALKENPDNRFKEPNGSQFSKWYIFNTLEEFETEMARII